MRLGGDCTPLAHPLTFDDCIQKLALKNLHPGDPAKVTPLILSEPEILGY